MCQGHLLVSLVNFFTVSMLDSAESFAWERMSQSSTSGSYVQAYESGAVPWLQGAKGMLLRGCLDANPPANPQRRECAVRRHTSVIADASSAVCFVIHLYKVMHVSNNAECMLRWHVAAAHCDSRLLAGLQERCMSMCLERTNTPSLRMYGIPHPVQS